MGNAVIIRKDTSKTYLRDNLYFVLSLSLYFVCTYLIYLIYQCQKKYYVRDRARFTRDRQSAFVHYSERIYIRGGLLDRISPRWLVRSDKKATTAGCERASLFCRLLKLVAGTCARHLLPDLKILSRGPRGPYRFCSSPIRVYTAGQ